MTPSAIGLIDTHAHLEDPRLRFELDAVLERARAAGLVQILAIGTTAEDSLWGVEAAAERPGIYAAVGVHPNHAAEAAPGDWERIEALASRPGVVALGETGLDRFRKNTPFPIQQEWFDRHLRLGHERGLPVVIHCRDSAEDLIAQLRELHRPVCGVAHSFTGTWEQAEAFLELGLYISFAGMITFANKTLDALREVVARVPDDRLLVETDSPYLSPHPHRGATNEPARVAITAERVAQIRGVALAELAQMTTTNARRLFSLPTGQSI